MRFSPMSGQTSAIVPSAASPIASRMNPSKPGRRLAPTRSASAQATLNEMPAEQIPVKP